jgi:hypothetical protein
MHPYTEDKKDDIRIRTFSSQTPEEELKWHWDEENRIVKPLSENDWLFQFDNELPFKIDRPISIEAGVIHRVIRGTTDLKVSIEIF